jgi:hypothetical protein
MGGYQFFRNKMVCFEPSVTLKKVGDEQLSIDVFSKVYINRLNWAAFSYSSSGKMNFLFGLHIIKMVYAGYNYEYTLSKIAQYSGGTHEIYLGINIGLINVSDIRQTVE